MIKFLGSVVAIAVVVALVLCPAVAKADSTELTLGIGNPAISGYTGPYATVTVDRTSSTQATITFTSLTNSGNIYLLGDGGTVGINVNATSWILGTVTGSNAGTGFTPGPWTNGGAGNEDGFGSFNQTIKSFDGFGHSSSTISFTITDTSGTWSSAANVLKDNGSGYDAAAHIFVTSDPAKESNGATTTGYATNGTVPEPGVNLLLGCSVLVLGGFLRRFA